MNAHKLAFDSGAAIHLQLPVTDIADHIGADLQFGEMLDLQIAGDTAVDHCVVGMDLPGDHTVFTEHQQPLGAGLAEHVTLDTTVNSQAAREMHIADDVQIVGDQTGELADLDTALLFLAEHLLPPLRRDH